MPSSSWATSLPWRCAWGRRGRSCSGAAACTPCLCTTCPGGAARTHRHWHAARLARRLPAPASLYLYRRMSHQLLALPCLGPAGLRGGTFMRQPTQLRTAWSTGLLPSQRTAVKGGHCGANGGDTPLLTGPASPSPHHGLLLLLHVCLSRATPMPRSSRWQQRWRTSCLWRPPLRRWPRQRAWRRPTRWQRSRSRVSHSSSGRVWVV